MESKHSVNLQAGFLIQPTEALANKVKKTQVKKSLPGYVKEMIREEINRWKKKEQINTKQQFFQEQAWKWGEVFYTAVGLAGLI